jgi:hypothetical protein
MFSPIEEKPILKIGKAKRRIESPQIVRCYWACLPTIRHERDCDWLWNPCPNDAGEAGAQG